MQIHVGAKRFIKKKDVAEVERAHFKLNKRLENFCELFWPKSVHLYSLSGTDSSGARLQKITDSDVKALYRILNEMTWDQDNFFITEPSLRDLLRHHTNYIRSKVRTANLTPEGRLKKAQQKKEKLEKKNSELVKLMKEKKVLKSYGNREQKGMSSGKVETGESSDDSEPEMKHQGVGRNVQNLNNVDTCKDMFSGEDTDNTQYDP